MSDPTAPSTLSRFSHEIAELVERASASVVAIHSDRTASSGFIWRPGLVVTADEALAEESDIAVVLAGGARASASVVGRDPSTDVALLRLGGGDGSPIALTSTSLRAGQIAVAVGSRAGSTTAVVGNVSFVGEQWHSVRGGRIDARIELNMPLGRTAEGGVVIDAEGRAFGMPVFGPRRRVLLIPAATIERVATRLLSHGRIARGYLGLRLQRVTVDGHDDTGAIVLEVDASGPAAAAGVRQGDVVASLDGRSIGNVHALARNLHERVGEAVRLSILRAGSSLDVAVTVGERPPA